MTGNLHECPDCGRPLKVSASGKAGFCPFHKKWYAADGSAEAAAEAAKLNAEYQEEQQREKRRIETEHKNAKMEEARKRRRGAMVKIAAVLLVVAIVAAAYVWFSVIPNSNYSAADDLLAQGDYAGAMEKFLSLNGHRDSDDKAVLCEALIRLQENDVVSAMQMLERLAQSEDKALAGVLRNSMVPVVADWKANGIAPEALLSLLERADEFDTDGKLDREALSIEAHVALLGGEDVVEWYVADMNGDQESDLVVLKSDYTVNAYRMLEDGNAKVTLDRAMTAQCLISFGDTYQEKDAAMALQCYQKAFDLHQDAQTKQKVAGGYQSRATASEAADDYDAALADARYAYDVLVTKEAFAFYYDMMLRSCYAQEEGGQAVALWERFAEDNATQLVSYDMSADAATRAGELSLEYAKALSSWKDPACIDWLVAAREKGVDISEALLAAIDRFDIGETRVQLRLLAMDLYKDAPEEYAQQTDLLTGEIVEALGNWKNMSIEAQDVFELLRTAESIGVELDAAQAQAAYRDAALAVAAQEQLTGYAFVDFDADGGEELIGLSGEGALVYYVMEDSFVRAAMHQDGIVNPTLELVEGETPTILVTAGAADAYGVYIYADGALKKAFVANGIVDYARDGSAIAYGVELEGSIRRCDVYNYDLTQPAVAATRVSTDWQQQNYPMPETAEAALQRYFETMAYALPEEAALLTATVAHAGFALDAAIPVPEAPGTVAAAAYDVAENTRLYEATYVSGGNETRIYVAMVNEDGWKFAGAAELFCTAAADVRQEYGVGLLALNDTATATLEKKGDRHQYRVLVSHGSRVQLIWQAGEKQGTRDAYNVRLYSSENLTEAVIGYTLKLSPNKQMSTPLFLAPGVYYVVVEAAGSDAGEYNLLLQAEQDLYVEQEGNDTLATANAIEVNQSYTGSLFDKNDVDTFAFTLEQPGAVNVVLQADESDTKQVRYNLALANANNSAVLTSAQMAGNVRQTETGAVYLGAGRYVVQIAKGASWSAWEYTLTVEYTQPEHMEIEANNTSETATEIPVNVAVQGSFGVEGDVDCFRFTLDSDAVIQPRLSFNPMESGSKAYVMTIMEGSTKLQTINIGGRESTKVIVPLALKAGTYTVKLENPRFVQQGYELTIVSQPTIAAEDEPNNELAQATALPVGAQLTGVLTSEDDVDMYKLVLEEQITATLSFKFPQTTENTTVFTVILEQNGKTQWTQNVKGETGGFAQAMQIPAGEYYIRVKTSNWISAIYTIGLE